MESDILQFETSKRFDVIFAADFIEHISTPLLDATLKKIAMLLRPGGRVVIHTWPNRLAYDYKHRMSRRQIRSLGSYLPRNQRTYYEDLMHISEQTPSSLRRALRRNFRSSEVWVGNGHTPLGPGNGAPIKKTLREYDSIFAVASDSVVNCGEIAKSISQAPLDPEKMSGVRISAAVVPDTLQADETVTGTVEVANGSMTSMSSFPPHPVHLSYHWYRDGELVCRDGLRSPLLPGLNSGQSQAYSVWIKAPDEAGAYELVLTLVQEFCFWFSDKLPECVWQHNVTVTRIQ